MSKQVTLGGDRLGSGKKMKVDLRSYERSTHDLSFMFRNTQASGTLVPFLKLFAQPGDTFDINIDCDIKTHPTVGPLFGSFKVQLDVFQIPIRLYQGKLHNNQLKIGLDMASVKLPVIELLAQKIPTDEEDLNIDISQINPSCLLAYLGIRGVGNSNESLSNITRKFNAVPILAYWDIYKNYYANKQEEIGAVIHNSIGLTSDVDSAEIITNGGTPDPYSFTGAAVPIPLVMGSWFYFNYTTAFNPEDILIHLDGGEIITLKDIEGGGYDNGSTYSASYDHNRYGDRQTSHWSFRTATESTQLEPTVTTFDLNNIDMMRQMILEKVLDPVVNINDFSGWSGTDGAPYAYLHGSSGNFTYMMNTQEGLGLKTYQSDIFNNWLSTEWIDGTNGIAEVTAIDVSGGTLEINSLILARKVFDMLNAIAVSGGSYQDWIYTNYDQENMWQAESPVYMGGLIKELVFQEVISNSDSGTQPLGTLGGRGVMGKKHKGGYVNIKCSEHSYIIGIISLTPKIDYSQGNDWDVHLLTMDDPHKPALDQIGFQDLITEQMAWWNTYYDSATTSWIQKSAGKQPAWLNYMTNYNKTFGNFAINTNEMFMTLNRRYEHEIDGDEFAIKDLTTYIDPVKFNHLFAQTSLDAMNFWTTIAVDIEARRKMSAKIMPNL